MVTEPEADGRVRPSGRAAVMDAVLDAATELMADGGPKAATVRAIAQRAGVNHALVHRCFGSKEDLVGAVITREPGRFRVLAQGDGRPLEVFRRLLRCLSERGASVRFLARASLDGSRTEPLETDALLFRDVVGLVERQVPSAGTEEPTDPRVAVAALGSMALGWRVFGEFLASGLGLDTMAPALLDGAIDEFITSVMPVRRAERIAGAGGS